KKIRDGKSYGVRRVQSHVVIPSKADPPEQQIGQVCCLLMSDGVPQVRHPHARMIEIDIGIIYRIWKLDGRKRKSLRWTRRLDLRGDVVGHLGAGMTMLLDCPICEGDGI